MFALKRRNSDLLIFSSDSSSDEEGLFEQCSSVPIRRMAIIDTCNVMHACSGYAMNLNPNSLKKKPDALGILLLVKQLLQEGFDVKMYLPVSYMAKEKVANRFILEQLHRLDFLTIIDDGSHDDLIILEMAKMVGGFVISNDKFRDHIEAKGLMHVIKTKTVEIQFQQLDLKSVEFCGKRTNRYFFGFRLILKPKPKAMYAEPSDSSFSMVFAQRMIRNELKIRHGLEVMGVIADYVQQKMCGVCNIFPPKLEYFDILQHSLPDNFNDFFELFKLYKLENI